MNARQKKMLWRIISSASLFALSFAIPYKAISLPILFLSYLTAGYDVLWQAVCNIKNGQLFDENFLMAIATVGAIATREYHEAVFVMVFYQVGELFQNIATHKSRKSIAALCDLKADTAHLLKDGIQTDVDPAKIQAGDIVVVRAGEKIPLDGIVTNGNSNIDTSSLTGESEPVFVREGAEVLSGCINISGVIYVKVTRPLTESTVSKILELVENSALYKSKSEAFITKFARYYTPAVVIGALLVAILPPLFLGMADGRIWSGWIYRAMTFLVISCPCALVLSVPLTFFCGIGHASKNGILIKGGAFIETLAKCDTVIFDKTGTLTEGRFTVTAVNPLGITENELLAYASACESFSNHPIAKAIATLCPPPQSVDDFCEHAGLGTEVKFNGKTVHAGNISLMQNLGINCCEVTDTGTAVYIAVDKNYVGSITLSDTLKETSADTVKKLHSLGMDTVMLTGDKQKTAEHFAKALGIRKYYSQLLPADKVQIAQDIKTSGKKIAFVGDGINDAPVLSYADIGIAMGGIGSDAAIEAADIVLMDDNPQKIVTAINICKKVLKIARQNIVFVLFIKAVVLLLGALGLAGMWAAVFADVGVAVLAILNAIRTKK